MKKTYALLTMAILVLSSTVFAIPALAVPIQDTPAANYPVQWYVPNGQVTAASLATNPDYLKIYTLTHVSHNTRITVQGLDCFGQPVEGIAVNLWQSDLSYMFNKNDPATWSIPASTPPEYLFPVVDVHSGKEVTFAKITAIYQQGGEHCNSFKLITHGEPYKVVPSVPAHPVEYVQYLGSFHYAGYTPPYQPFINPGGIPGFPGLPTYPSEPSNPDPIRILVGWQDNNGNHIPDPPGPGSDSYTGAQSNTSLLIKGLDCLGNEEEVTVNVTVGSGTFTNPVVVPGVWRDVSVVFGAGTPTGDSYFVVTWPAPERDILTYELSVDHIGLNVTPRNIIANGTDTAQIQVSLLDMDNHLIHWSTVNGVPPIIINVVATGGDVFPSVTTLAGCNTNINVTIMSDTNARTIRIGALAVLPGTPGVPLAHPAVQLTQNTVMGFDGFNSVQTSVSHIEFLDGHGTGYYYNVFIKLVPGCNLISIPVFPPNDITPSMLWNASGSTVVHTIMWYQASDTPGAPGVWNGYSYDTKTVTGPGGNDPIIPGRGYWIKAEKECTLVISGKWYDQAPFVPPEIHLGRSWNLVGVVSLVPMTVGGYLQSLGDQTNEFGRYGPVWVWNTDNMQWYRLGANDTLWPTWGFWLANIGADGYIGP